MNTSPGDARVLVASADVGDAQEILARLRPLFSNVTVSTDASTAVEDFEKCNPDVIVLAFATLPEAQRYYLGLYRLGSVVNRQHRTVLLCTKEDVAEAFDLCRKEFFDDYVLYWPQSFDGTRLAMSVWIACREVRATPAAVPTRAELVQHGVHLGKLDEAIADPNAKSADDLRRSIEPALGLTKPFASTLRAIRPIAMVVDDDEFARLLVKQSLESENWSVVLASDGTDAFSKLRHTRPDVILMDVRMPGSDGLTLTRRLKASPELASIPIVMMTGDSTKRTLTDSMQAGAVAFVVKPFSKAALLAKLESVAPR